MPEILKAQECVNGMSLICLKSDHTNDEAEINQLENIVKKIENNSYFICFFDFKIEIGLFIKNKFILFDEKIEFLEDLKFIQKLRIFNENEELYIWKSGKKLKWRHRKDNKGNERNERKVIDINQVISGNTSTTLSNGWSKLTDTSGTELYLPFDLQDNIKDSQKLLLHVRNYIGFENTYNQPFFEDQRFVGFVLNNIKL